MDAPFTFGKQVAFTDFTDREKDSKFLTDNLLALTNTTLISPRRWGKSSLVERVTSTIEKERKDFLVARIDLFNCRSESDFYHKYASGILSCATTRFEELASAVTKYLSRYAPTLQLSNPLGSRELSFRLEIRDTERSFDEILDLPQKIAEDRKKKVIVCIDEFQSICDYGDSLSFQKALRAHWQRHKDVAYCLYGSKRRMMNDIFSNPENPFYKFGNIMFLEKISKKDWVPFIEKRFMDTGKSICRDASSLIVDLTDEHPYYVQQLSQLSWFRTEDKCTTAIVKDALGSLVNQLDMTFSMIMQNLTVKQVAFLCAVSDGVENFSSVDALRKYNYGTAANVKNIKEKLERMEIIDFLPGKVEFLDPILKYWLDNVYRK